MTFYVRVFQYYFLIVLCFKIIFVGLKNKINEKKLVFCNEVVKLNYFGISRLNTELQ